MELDEKSIQEFIRVYRSAYGEELSLEEARETATRLLRLYQIVYRPTPQELANGLTAPTTGADQKRLTAKAPQQHQLPFR